MPIDPRLIDTTPYIQGLNEEIQYIFDWINIGTPSLPTFTVMIMPDGTDVSGTCLSGVPSILGTQVTSPFVLNISKNVFYRLTCRVTVGGNILESFINIQGKL